MSVLEAMVLSTETFGVEAQEEIEDDLKYAKALFHHPKPKDAMRRLQSKLQDAIDLRAPIVFRKSIQKYMAVLRHHDLTIAQQMQDEGYSDPPKDPAQDRARIKMFIAHYERFIDEAEGTARQLKMDAASRKMRRHNLGRLAAMEQVDDEVTSDDSALLADNGQQRGNGGGRGRGQRTGSGGGRVGTDHYKKRDFPTTAQRNRHMQVCKQQTANGKSRSMKCCDVRKDISKCGQSPLTNAEFGIWLKAQKYSDEKYAAKRPQDRKYPVGPYKPGVHTLQIHQRDRAYHPGVAHPIRQ